MCFVLCPIPDLPPNWPGTVANISHGTARYCICWRSCPGAAHLPPYGWLRGFQNYHRVTGIRISLEEPPEMAVKTCEDRDGLNAQIVVAGDGYGLDNSRGEISADTGEDVVRQTVIATQGRIALDQHKRSAHRSANQRATSKRWVPDI